MCAKPEPSEYYQPISDLLQEFVQYAPLVGVPPMRAMPWVGVTAYCGLLENA